MHRRNFMQAGLGLTAAAVTSLARAQRKQQSVEYDGADDVAAFKAKIAEMSKDRVLMVVHHWDKCPHCHRLFNFLDELRNKGELPELDVLKVEVTRYPAIAKSEKTARGVPESQFFKNGSAFGVFMGAPHKIEELKEILSEVLADARKAGVTPAPQPK